MVCPLLEDLTSSNLDLQKGYWVLECFSAGSKVVGLAERLLGLQKGCWVFRNVVELAERVCWVLGL